MSFTISGLFIFAGGFVAILLGISQLFYPKRSRRHRVAFFLFLALGLLQVHIAALLSNFTPKIIHYYRVHIVILFFIGPLAYIYFMEMMAKNRNRDRDKWHFIPGFIALMLLMPFFIKSGPEKLAEYKRVYEELQIGPYEYLIFIGSFHVLGYLIGTFYRSRYYWHRQILSEKEVARLAFIVLGFGFLASISALTVFVFRSPYSILVSAYFMTAISLGIFLFSNRYPEFFSVVQITAQKAKYRRSVIDNVDVDAVLRDMENLLQVQKLYRDDSISLKSLAAEVGIGTHQLSQIINERMQKNFHTLVNEMRIEEACDLLIRTPGRTVLSVAYHVGFNSKSSFNTAFQKFTGLTPTDFRREHVS